MSGSGSYASTTTRALRLCGRVHPRVGGEHERKGKIVVRVNFHDRLKLDDAARRTALTTNSIRTAGYVDPANLLLNPRYELVEGKVE